jgi:hypothetical protein
MSEKLTLSKRLHKLDAVNRPASLVLAREMA